MNFANEIFKTKPGRHIVAVFKDGSSAVYTTNILYLLKTDNSVDYIYDAATGEIL